MRIDWTGRAVDLRPATVEQAGDVLDLLDEAAAWLHERGITDQWPPHFELSGTTSDGVRDAARSA